VTAFLTLVALFGLAGLFLLLGFGIADERLAGDRAKLDQQRQLLDAEWRTLDATQRIRGVFLAARRAMQHEADRYDHRNGP